MKNRVIVVMPRHPAFYQDFYELAIRPVWESKGYVIDPPIWAEGAEGAWISDLEKQLLAAGLAIIDLTEGTSGLFYALGMAQRLRVDTVMITANSRLGTPPAMLGRCIYYGREGGRFSLVKLTGEMEQLASNLPEVRPRHATLSQEALKQCLPEIKRLLHSRLNEPQIADALEDEIRYEEAKKDRRTQRLISDHKVTVTVKAAAFPLVGNSAQYKRQLQDIVNEIFGQIVEVELTPLIG